MKRIDFDVRPVISANDRARIAQLGDDRWFELESSMAALEMCLDCVMFGQTLRPEGCLIFGPPGMGKTLILKKLERTLNDDAPASPNAAGVVQENCAVIRMPVVGTNDRIQRAILRHFNHPIDMSIRSSEDASRRLMRDKKLIVLAVDEIQDASRPASSSSTRKLLDEFKSISNELRIHLVFAGTEEALATISKDRQLSSRVSQQYELRPFVMDERYFSLLATLESEIELREASGLASERLGDIILRASGGITDDIFKIIRHSAKIAIQYQTERITEDILRYVLSRLIRASLTA